LFFVCKKAEYPVSCETGSDIYKPALILSAHTIIMMNAHEKPGDIGQARIFALIPCGGLGARSGEGLPKQYREIAGLPMVAHTLAAFAAAPRICKTAVVIAADDALFAKHVKLPNATFFVASRAGNTRAITVLNGLNVLLEQGAGLQDWVLVHDAARCLITPEQIYAVIDACLPDDVGGLMACKLADTLKQEVAGRVSDTIYRGDKWLAQTPQMFRIGPLRDALQMVGDDVTDESSAMEALGLSPKLIAGSAQNFKVTYAQDFALAEAVLRSRVP
jgi:2-C-methyl-D-erythritol 4-phosphate cytidylyltransferase